MTSESNNKYINRVEIQRQSGSGGRQTAIREAFAFGMMYGYSIRFYSALYIHSKNLLAGFHCPLAEAM